MSARDTVRFAVFDVLTRRGGRVMPHEADQVAEEITEEVLNPMYRWALRELGEATPDDTKDTE